EAIFEKKIGKFISAFVQPMDESLTFEEKLRLWTSRHFDLMRENPRIPFLFINEIVTNPARLNVLYEKYFILPKTAAAHIQAELDREAAHGRIRPISAFNLALTILSLNIMPFLGRPILSKAVGGEDSAYEAFLEQRREENIQTVLRRVML
ncbi:MAG: hypothetical protein ACRCUT_04800, partial [Spirochaetota bacterium]